MFPHVIIHIAGYQQRLELVTIVGDLTIFKQFSIIIDNQTECSLKGMQYMKQNIIQTPTNDEMYVGRKRQRGTR